jgi:hypothetical protein
MIGLLVISESDPPCQGFLQVFLEFKIYFLSPVVVAVELWATCAAGCPRLGGKAAVGLVHKPSNPQACPCAVLRRGMPFHPAWLRQGLGSPESSLRRLGGMKLFQEPVAIIARVFKDS